MARRGVEASRRSTPAIRGLFIVAPLVDDVLERLLSLSRPDACPDRPLLCGLVVVGIRPKRRSRAAWKRGDLSHDPHDVEVVARSAIGTCVRRRLCGVVDCQWRQGRVARTGPELTQRGAACAADGLVPAAVRRRRWRLVFRTPVVAAWATTRVSEGRRRQRGGERARNEECRTSTLDTGHGASFAHLNPLGRSPT